MILYGLTLAGSNYMAPVFAGFVAGGQNWEWVMVRLIFLAHEHKLTSKSTSLQFSVVSSSQSSSSF